jgi:hypothetical protein
MMQRGSTDTVSSGAAAGPGATLTLATGTLVDGRYQVRGVAGSGGFSVVYRA